MGGNKTTKLPEGWRWETLDKISTNIQYGISKSSASDKVGPKLLRITDIQDGKVDWDNVPFCECSSTEEGRYILENNDIVFARTGATTGKSFLVNNPDYALFASYLIRVQCDREVVDPNYLYVFLKSPPYWKYITQGARGGTLAGFNATMLSKIEIPLPPTLDDQIRISSELECRMVEVETMRRAALRQKEAAAAMQGAILQEVFPHKEGDELPEGWEWVELDSLFTIDKQQIDKSNTIFNSLQVIGLENIESDTRKYVPSEENEENGSSTCFLFSTKHVLYGKLRPYLNKVYLPDGDGRCSMELLPLLPKNGYSRDFIAAVVQSEIVIAFAVKHSTGGRMPRADMNKINKLKAPIPSSNDECNYIGNYLNIKFAELDKMRQAAEQQLEAIEALPGGILREVFDFEEDT